MFQQIQLNNPPTASKFGVRPNIFKFFLVSQSLLWAYLKILKNAKPREPKRAHA